MRYQIIRKYRIDAFVLLSFLFHILFGYFGGYLIGPESMPKKPEPMKVTFLEKKKPLKKPEPQGQILETPKPAKKEKPIKKSILSQYNSRMHSNMGEKSDTYRDHETVVPMSRPRVSPTPPAMRKKKTPEHRIIKKTTKNRYKKAPTAREKFRERAEQEMEREEKSASPLQSVIRKKYSDRKQEKTPSMMDAPLLDGADLGKYAKLDTGAKEDEASADSDTISLDTQEFKYVSYFAQIKRKIELVWSYPPAAGRMGLYGKLILRFTILNNGTLANLKLVDSTGHTILDEEALKAVKLAAPYPPFPKRINKSRLNIVASFSYYPSFGLVR